jgi:hypothetical protein
VRAQLAALESSGFLEQWLWPNLSGSSSLSHHLVTVWMLNEKFLEGTEPWTLVQQSPAGFAPLFATVLAALQDPDAHGISLQEESALLVFLVRCFQSMVSTLPPPPAGCKAT